MRIIRLALGSSLSVAMVIVVCSAQAAPPAAETNRAAQVQDAAAPAKKEATPKKPPKGTAKLLHQARRSGWLMISQIVPVLEQGDPTDFPAGAMWLKEFRKATKDIDPDADPATWPMIDVDQLVTHNPNFWLAHYEIAPGDPAMLALHSGLLYLGCEPQRGSCVMTIGLQRPDIPAAIRPIMEKLAGQAQLALRESNAAVQEGIELYDAGKYAEALKKHEEALALCPQNGFAHYEWGLTFRQQKWAAAGLALGAKPEKVVLNDKRRTTPAEAVAAFAKAREHNPFQWRAFQGDDPEVVGRLMPFLEKGMRNWEKIIKADAGLVDDDVVAGLSEGLQAAQCHDLALVARQIVVARRGRFAPQDHPFLCASLRKLAPGESTEELLRRLGGTALKMRLLIAPEKDSP